MANSPRRGALNKRQRELIIGLAVVLVFGSLAALFVPRLFAPHAPKQVVQGVFTGQTLDVTAAPYSADMTCTSDDSKALQQAFGDAQAGPGNTVYFPPGHYCIKVGGPVAALAVTKQAIHVDGAGRDAVTITEQVKGQDLMSVKSDGTLIENITLDAQSCNCEQGHGFGSGANNTTFQHARVLGGTTPARFPIYFSGGGQKAGYATGNKIIDVELNDQICDDALSWSNQHDSLVQNVTETGAHIALFIDENTVVDGYTFYPGPSQMASCPGRVTGWGITAPSSGITIKDFTTYGAAGFIRAEKSPTVTTTNVTIQNEQIMVDGNNIEVQDVHGLTIDGGSFNQHGQLRFRPTNAADDITIKNVTSLPAVRFVLKPGKASVGQGAGLHFIGNTYPGFSTFAGLTPYTFSNPYGGKVTFDVAGSTWSSPVGGGLWLGNRTIDNSTCFVAGLVGYTGAPSVC